jgi:dihydrodipicolinate reductase
MQITLVNHQIPLNDLISQIIKVQDTPFGIANIYGPNKVAEQETFYKRMDNIFELLHKAVGQNIFIGGGLQCSIKSSN